MSKNLNETVKIKNPFQIKKSKVNKLSLVNKAK